MHICVAALQKEVEAAIVSRDAAEAGAVRARTEFGSWRSRATKAEVRAADSTPVCAAAAAAHFYTQPTAPCVRAHQGRIAGRCRKESNALRHGHCSTMSAAAP